MKGREMQAKQAYDVIVQTWWTCGCSAGRGSPSAPLRDGLTQTSEIVETPVYLALEKLASFHEMNASHSCKLFIADILFSFLSL